MSTVAPFVAVSTTVCPNRRPPRPKHPKFTQFHRSGLHFGRIHPQHRQYGDSSKAYGIATASVGGGRAWPDNEPTRRTTRQQPAPPAWRAPEGPEGRVAGQRADAPSHAQRYSAAGVEGAGGTGGPGRASRRGAERSEVAQPRGRPDPPAPGTPAGPSCASCGRRQGLARQRDDAPNHTSTTCPTGMEGTGGTGGHGQPDPKAPGTLAAPPVTPHTRRRRCGGHRRARRARLRCPWAAAGPGRTTSRRARPRTAIQRRRCGGRRRVRRARAGFEARRRTQ